MGTIWVVVVTVLMAARGVGSMERVDMPIEALEAGADVVFVGTCERVEEKSARSGSFQDTTYFHHMRVERVMKDGGGVVHAGDVVAVISATHLWRGSGTPPTYGSGHRGMVAKGGRARVYCRKRAAEGEGKMLWLDVLEPNGWQAPERGVLFIGADDEYRSEVTMPALSEWLSKDVPGVVKGSVAYPSAREGGEVDPAQRSYISNLGSLERAEAAVMFMRWRELDAAQWAVMERFFATGRPVVGLRTSTHMLRLKDPALAAVNDEAPVRVWGQKWITHAGSDSRTRVLGPVGSKHPILRGVGGGFTVRSWLYHVEPLPADCTVLLWGEVVKADGSAGEKQPIVWVREGPKELRGGARAARRMAFTTLGHPEDFEEVQVRRLVEQMVLWAIGDESAIPAEGVSGAAGAGYVGPPTR